MSSPSENMKGSNVRVVVTCHTGDLSRATSQVKKHGMKVESVLDGIGVITGEIPAGKLAELEKTPGMTVERQQDVQLPPPDAAVQ